MAERVQMTDETLAQLVVRVAKVEKKTEELRHALADLRRKADIYQATVRPILWSDSPDARRAFERQRALQADLLDALGKAHDALSS